MPTATLPHLKYMPREQLASLLLDSSTEPTIAVIDVRGDDHIGGHIRGSTNAPSSSLDYTLPELVRTLAGKDKVVFHCALSQERGPRAAKRYLEEKQKKVAGKTEAAQQNPEKDVQEVYVLEQGFVGWQDK